MCSTAPNLNLLGTREPETYGLHTLADVEKLCRDTAAQLWPDADCRQSNREGELIDFIHEAGAKKAVRHRHQRRRLIRTPRSPSMTRYGVSIPTVEVHVSNIYAARSFRHHSFVAKAAFATLSGFGIEGYRLAITGLAAKIGAKAKA